MTNDAAASILSALGVAAFERRADGSFVSLGPLPDWFAHLAQDRTFPFLGSFLDDARTHWDAARDGRLRSGWCTERDGQGREFLFEVSAIGGPGGQFLVFERPAAAEELQDVLQRARLQALDHEARTRDGARLRALTATLELQVQEARRLGRAVTAGPRAPVANGSLTHQPTTEGESADDRLRSVLDAIVETSRLVARAAEQG